MTILKSFFLMALVLVSALIFAGSAQAGDFNGSAFGHCKANAKSCSNFSIGFSDRLGRISVGDRATVCWLGNCKNVRAIRGFSVGTDNPVFLANYKSVGPYRCGSLTRITLIYKGKNYTEQERIACKPL